MLRYLAELRFLSLPQLARLCCPAERRDLSEKAARRHLRALFDAGLVDVLPVSRAALAPPDAKNDAALLHGSAPNVYVPTKEGIRLLCRAGNVGEEQAVRPAPSYGPRNTLFLAHELAVRDVRVWLEEICRRSGHELESWRDGKAALIDLGRIGTSQVVRPDAWFALRLSISEKRTVLVGLVEVDRGTERGDRRWKEKLDAYGLLYSGTTLREVTGYVNARVLVVTPCVHRRDRLAAFIGQEGCALAPRIWLAERSVLSRTDLGEQSWRRGDDSFLHPLVPRPK